jgi:hypothetical protein
MPFYLSPVVNVIEKDFSLFIPAVATSIGATVIDTQWGPIGEAVLIGRVDDFQLQYGLPDDRNAKDWFTVWNFLQYTTSIRVARVANTSGPGVYTTTWIPASTKAVGDIILPVADAQAAFPFRYKAYALSGSAPYQTANASVNVWSVTTLVAGDYVIPTVPNGYRYKVTVGGLTVGPEPTWPTSGTTPITSGAATLVLDGIEELGAGPNWGNATALGSVITDGDITWENVGPINGRPTNAYYIADGSGNETDNESSKVVKNALDWENLEGTRETQMSADWIGKYPGAFGNRISVAYRDGRTYTPTDWAANAAVATGVYRKPTDEVANPYRFEATTGGTTAQTDPWSTGLTALVAGDFVTPSVSNGYRYRVVTGGTLAGATEPVWPTSGTTPITHDVGPVVLVLDGASGLGAEPDWSLAPEVGDTITDGTVTWTNRGPWESTWENWNYKNLFQFRPESTAGQRDEVAVVVFLDDIIVETFVVDAVRGRVDSNNQPNYIGTSIASFSKYVYFNDEKVLEGFTSGVTELYSQNFGDTPFDLAGGLDGDAPTADDYIQVWTNVFQDAEELDINLLMLAGASGTVSKFVIENIATTRMDCVAFVSPHQADVVNAINPVSNLVTRRTGNGTDNINVNSSYGFFDGNYKYQFDQFNDKYRWLPLNGDMAGLAAATDNIADPWWSFAGYNRGAVKNVTRLAFNPGKAQRDELYTYSINPVVMTKGEGALLFGDRTTLLRPSAFRAVNVRRLFIVIEKAIATASKYLLFEFNDETTQAQFVSMVTPFLRDVQGRRGIQTDKPGRPGFLVVADERVNTPEVIDRQEFKALILIRPNRSINFIELVFAATKTGAIFEELVPKAVSEI